MEVVQKDVVQAWAHAGTADEPASKRHRSAEGHADYLQLSKYSDLFHAASG